MPFSQALFAQLLEGAGDEDVVSCRASIMRVGIAIFMIASISAIARGSTFATGILEPNLTMFLACNASIMGEAIGLAEDGDAEEC